MSLREAMRAEKLAARFWICKYHWKCSGRASPIVSGNHLSQAGTLGLDLVWDPINRPEYTAPSQGDSSVDCQAALITQVTALLPHSIFHVQFFAEISIPEP